MHNKLHTSVRPIARCQEKRIRKGSDRHVVNLRWTSKCQSVVHDDSSNLNTTEVSEVVFEYEILFKAKDLKSRPFLKLMKGNNPINR